MIAYKDYFFNKKEEKQPRAGYIKLQGKYIQGKSEVHAFFEAEDDEIFYNPALKQVYKDYEIIPYYQKGKKNVLDAYKEIDWTKFNKSKVLFFTDKDFDDIIHKQLPIDDNIFQTKYYSIENYVINKEALEYIMLRVYAIKNSELRNQIHEKYAKSIESFTNQMRSIICLILIYRQKSKHMDLNKIKLGNYFLIKDLKCYQKKYLPENKYNAIMQGDDLLKKITAKNKKTLPLIIQESGADDKQYSLSQLLKNRVILAQTPFKKSYIRGKYEMWFFLEFIKNIEHLTKELNKKIKLHNRENPENIKEKHSKLFQLDSSNIFDFITPKIEHPKDVIDFLLLNFEKI